MGWCLVVNARCVKTKKVIYTPREAQERVAELNKHGVYFNHYRCGFCGHYHVGHLPKEQQIPREHAIKQGTVT